MAGTIAPAPWFEGIPFGRLWTYRAGTSTLEPTYQNAELSVLHANPIELDARGWATIYLDNTSYKFILKDLTGAIIRTVDNIASTGLGTQGGLSESFQFGGDSTSPIVVTAYPAGATIDKLHAGTGVLVIDSAMFIGDYALEAMMIGDGASTVRAALFNLSGGSPNTVVTGSEITSNHATGERKVSGAITFPASGAEYTYGIKTRTNGSGSGYIWNVKLIRLLDA